MMARRLSGARAMLEQLRADAVTAIFGNPGTTEQSFMALLPEYPDIPYYLGLHEGVVVSMAEAYARATRRPAFVQLHIAPGLGNAMGMLYNAHAGHSPLVVYVGQSPTTGLLQDPILSADLVAMARPVTKWGVQVLHAREIPQTLRRAFKTAEEPPQGPVLVAVPSDVLDAEADVVIQPTTFVHWRARPARGFVEDAATLLLDSRAPALAIGDHVGLADAQDEVVAVAELIGAPILNPSSFDSNVPASHPLYRPRVVPLYSSAVRDALRPFDVLLVVGTPLFQSIFPDAAGPIPPGPRVIHIDYDSSELGKTHPGDLLACADPKETLRELISELQHRATPNRRQAWKASRELRERETLVQREAAHRSHRESWNAVPISPHRLMAEVAATIPREAIIFDETITSSGSADTYLQVTERRFRARGGGIGSGMPGALGLQLAYPDRPVVGLVSDGASMYGITALWTAAHHRLPVTYVVCNNNSYRILKQNLREQRGGMDGPYPHMDLTDPQLRFDRIAESFGVWGRRVESPEDIVSALRSALEHPGPALVDVQLSRSM